MAAILLSIGGNKDMTGKPLHQKLARHIFVKLRCFHATLVDHTG
jgi:hypothetical protein